MPFSGASERPFRSRQRAVGLRAERSLSKLGIWISGGSTQAGVLDFEEWNSQVHREFPRNLDAAILRLRILSLRIDRRAQGSGLGLQSCLAGCIRGGR